MGDASWTVRRQLAATIGELPEAPRLEAAVALLTRYGSDPIAVDATVSGLRGQRGGRADRGCSRGADRGALLMW